MADGNLDFFNSPLFSNFAPNLVVCPAQTTLLRFLKKHIVLLINQKDYVTFLQITEMDYWAARISGEYMYLSCGSKPVYLKPAVRK